MRLLLDKIRTTAAKYPNRIAYKVGKNRINYSDLWKKSLEVSKVFSTFEGPIIIYGHKEINFLISIIACLISDKTYIPIDVSCPISRLREIKNISQAQFIVNVTKNKKLDIENFLFDELLSNRAKKYEKNNNVYIIFTSGTTGKPKGVPISKNNLNNFISWIINLKTLKNKEECVIFNQANFSFDLSVADIYYSLYMGFTMVSLDYNEEKEIAGIYNVLKENKVNIAFLTPTFIKLCLLDSVFCESNFPELKLIYFCGERLETNTVKKLFTRFPNLQIINAYGPTEATSAVSAIDITKDMLNEKILPVGQISNLATDVEIINNEIILKGDSVFSGYLGGEIGGYYNLDGKNCYKTGDVGYIINNNLYCEGRIDSQIKYKGYRIELTDIELNLTKIVGIKEAMVIPLYNAEKSVKTLKAYVVVNNDISSEFIKYKLKEILPTYMIPSIIEFVDLLPMTENGKLDRRYNCD